MQIVGSVSHREFNMISRLKIAITDLITTKDRPVTLEQEYFTSVNFPSLYFSLPVIQDVDFRREKNYREKLVSMSTCVLLEH